MAEVSYALRWYLMLQLVGLAGLPLGLALFRRLPEHGYGLSKALGLLLTGWVFWLGVSFGWLGNNAGGVLIALALVAGVGLSVWGGYYVHRMAPKVLPEWRSVLASEGLFALTFGAGCLMRAAMPNIETAGGEKWMESAFLRAILRAEAFPPHDPWLSGFAISYYYFGYVIVALVTHLSAVPPAIAFNLAIAGLFALTCSGAYSLVYNLIRLDKTLSSRLSPALGGLLGPLLVAVMGNLEGALECLHARGVGPAAFWRWLGIRSIDSPPPPFSEGTWIPTRFFWWWQASRVLRDYTLWGEHQEVIDEFPSFSFILGDLHPHLLGLPFVLLAIGLALTLFLKGYGREENVELRTSIRPFRISSLVGWEFWVYAVCLGGLGFLNTWDFPIYLVLSVLAYVVGAVIKDGHSALGVVGKEAVVLFVVWLGLGIVLYLPFWLGFQSQAGGFLPNVFNPTHLPQFLIFFGPLLFLVTVFAIREGRHAGIRPVFVLAWSIGVLFCIFIFGAVLLALGVWLSRIGLLPNDGALVYLRAWAARMPIPGLEHIPNIHELISERLRQRLANPWTALCLIGLLVWSVSILVSRAQKSAYEVSQGSSLSVRTFVVLLVIIGGLLTLSVEYVYLRDHFGTRMNTVFKFYFQAWVLWGIVAAYALCLYIAERRVGLVAAAVILIALGLVYPALAIPARSREQGTPWTLDGIAHLAISHPEDYAAIAWLNQTVVGAPVLLEAPADQYRAYVYEGRVSAHTGLPTLLGWAGHEFQWRGTYTVQAQREQDIMELYATTSLARAQALLEEYHIRYVYVGPLERERYPAAGLEKFARLMQAVYVAPGVTIYSR